MDQIFHNQRNRAALQSGDAGKIGARDRLPRPNEIKYEVSVDLARSLIGSALLSSKRKRLCGGMEHFDMFSL